MVKQIETLDDLQKLLGRGVVFFLILSLLVLLLGVPFVVVPALSSLKGSIESSVALQSYVVVFGLMMTVSGATATLSANHAREVVKSLRDRFARVASPPPDLGNAVRKAEDLRTGVFIREGFVMVVSLAGIVFAVLLLPVYGGQPIPPFVVLGPLGVLFMAFAGLLSLLSHTALISEVSVAPQSAPPMPCAKCGTRLDYVEYYHATYCPACEAYTASGPTV